MEELPAKEGIKSNWNNKENLIFLLVFIFAAAVRIYYFFLTMNQPLWWDEAEYMSTAKGFAGIIDFPYHFSLNRSPGFPLLASLFYLLGISNEIVLRFFLAFVPSLIAIFLIYFVIKEMYSDKRIALISVAIFTLLWEHVFYSNRFHTENLSLIFGLLAIFVLFKVYIKKENFYFIKPKQAILYILIFSFLCIFLRSGNMMFLPIILLFMLMLNFYKLSKKVRVSVVLLLISLLILSFFILGPLAQKYPSVNLFYHYELPIGWASLNVFYGFYQSLVQYIPSVLFYAFLLGIILFLGKMILAPELLKRVGLNSEDREIKADIFNIALLSITLFFFVFILRFSSFEYRYFFIMLPGMFAFTAKGIIKFSEYVASLANFKKLSIVLIVVIMVFGLYTEWNHADNIVKYKISSYQQVKDSGIWIKEHSSKMDFIITQSTMQQAYYSERRVVNLDQFNNSEGFQQYIEEKKPKYVVLSVFQPHPQWAYEWPQQNNESIVPVQVYFDETEKTQPVLIVYAYNSS